MVKCIRAVNKKGENEKVIKYFKGGIEYILFVESKYIKVNTCFIVNKKAVEILKTDYIDYRDAPKSFIEKIYNLAKTNLYRIK